jgi:serine phosphatase RsbU (regulator of sigma subunit)
MRQALRPLRGALIATACIAVPICGPAVAHALTTPDVNVSAGPVQVHAPPVQVQVPQVPQNPVPTPSVPGPAGGVVGGATGAVNNAVNGVSGPVNQVTGSGGGGLSVPPGGGPVVSGPGPGPGSVPGPGSGPGGPGGPGAGASTSTGAGGASPAARSRAAAGARLRAFRLAARRALIRDARLSAARRSKAGKGGKNDPNIIERIEQVIPGPIWALIGALALLAAGFAIRSRFTAALARRLERQRAELLGDVGLLQRALLPDVPQDLRGIEVSVAYRPAEGPAAGGDFYDVFELDGGRTAIIVGDVCGHGRQALAVTALMRYTLRAYLGAGFSPRIALQVAGRTIQGDPDGELTTVVLAVYDPKAGTLTYACAGHEPPIVLGPAAHEPVTVASAPPIGGFMTTGQRETTVPLSPGSAVCFFTDGLVEARLGENMIGRTRLTELVTELAPGEGAQLLLDRLAAAADRAPDDMAACLVRMREDAVDAGGTRVEEIEVDPEDLEGERVREFLLACGMPEGKTLKTISTASAKASEFGGALLRVHLDGDGGRVEIMPTEVAALPVPTLAAEARRRAAIQISA